MELRWNSSVAWLKVFLDQRNLRTPSTCWIKIEESNSDLVRK
jgi:hypothetical protein